MGFVCAVPKILLSDALRFLKHKVAASSFPSKLGVARLLHLKKEELLSLAKRTGSFTSLPAMEILAKIGRSAMY